MKKIIFLLAAAWMMVACSNEEIATQEEVQYVSELKVNFGKGDSRVTATHSDKGLKFEWTDGDAIGIVSLDGSEKYIYLYKEDSKSFKSKNTGNRYSMIAGNTYFATRAHLNPTLSPETKTIDGKVAAVMEVGMGVGDGFDGLPMISHPFVADPDGTITDMHHLAGVLEIPLKLTAGSDPKTKYFLARSEKEIPLPNFDAIPEKPYLQNVEVRWFSSYYATGEFTLNADTYTSVFVPLTPGSYPDLDLYDSKSPFVKLHTFNDITIQRGKITQLQPTEISLNLKIGLIYNQTNKNANTRSVNKLITHIYIHKKAAQVAAFFAYRNRYIKRVVCWVIPKDSLILYNIKTEQ